jgi:hypothetical protein
MRLLAAPLLIALAALGACTTVPREPLAYLVFAGSDQCAVDVDERRYALPAQAAPLDRALKRLAKSRDGALVDAGEVLSYACYREAMTIVRRAGFARLGLVTAAPPDPNAPVEPPASDKPAPRRPS